MTHNLNPLQSRQSQCGSCGFSPRALEGVPESVNVVVRFDRVAPVFVHNPVLDFAVLTP